MEGIFLDAPFTPPSTPLEILVKLNMFPEMF